MVNRIGDYTVVDIKAGDRDSVGLSPYGGALIRSDALQCAASRNFYILPPAYSNRGCTTPNNKPVCVACSRCLTSA
jgi:hypothetical protein